MLKATQKCRSSRPVNKTWLRGASPIIVVSNKRTITGSFIANSTVLDGHDELRFNRYEVQRDMSSHHKQPLHGVGKHSTVGHKWGSADTNKPNVGKRLGREGVSKSRAIGCDSNG